MSIVAVDLAAKFSAAVWMRDDCTVFNQWDSWQRTQGEFIETITDPFDRFPSNRPELLVVEDLPQRVPWMTTIKDVCRLQGRIVERMTALQAAGNILFVPPHEWRRTYEGMGRGSGPDIVVPVAERYGYTPPDLTDRIKGRGDKTTAKKVATDYCAAYLIGRWAITYRNTHGTFDAPTATRYTKI